MDMSQGFFPDLSKFDNLVLEGKEQIQRCCHGLWY